MYYTLSIYPRLADELAEVQLISHIQSVLSHWGPFEIRLEGLHRSRDHWLFLTLAEGEAEVKRLYELLYTGILAEYRRDDVEFLPHLGLGLFIREGATYDWDNPQEADLDQERYDEALLQAKALPLHLSFRVEKLQLAKISDDVLEWAKGKRATFPEESRWVEVREFFLGDRGARQLD